MNVHTPKPFTKSTILHMRRVFERTKIPVAVTVDVPFDFDNPDEVAAYDNAKGWCREMFGDAFVWRADPAEGMAAFSFTTLADGVVFALSMTGARLRDP